MECLNAVLHREGSVHECWFPGSPCRMSTLAAPAALLRRKPCPTCNGGRLQTQALRNGLQISGFRGTLAVLMAWPLVVGGRARPRAGIVPPVGGYDTASIQAAWLKVELYPSCGASSSQPCRPLPAQLHEAACVC